VLAHSRGALGIGGWAILGLGTTALVVGVDRTPVVAKVVWLLGVATIVAARVRGGPTRSVARLAGVALVVAALYVVAMLVSNRFAERQASRWLRAQGLEATVVMVGPVPARPLAREVIARTADHYHFVELAWTGPVLVRVTHPPIAIGDDDPVAQAALRAPAVRGLRTWLRFPAFEVETTAWGHRVTIRDVRYARHETERPTTLGLAVVELGPDLEPR
jgi:hypothetical protein